MQRQRDGLVPNRGLKLAVFSGVWACHNGMFENYSLFTREGRLGNSWHTQIPRGTPGPTVCGIHSSRTPPTAERLDFFSGASGWTVIEGARDS